MKTPSARARLLAAIVLVSAVGLAGCRLVDPARTATRGPVTASPGRGAPGTGPSARAAGSPTPRPQPRPVASPASAAPPLGSTTARPPTSGTSRAPAPANGRRPVGGAPGKLLFGVGPTLDAARDSAVASSLAMFTTWYNGPGDLGFIHNWTHDLIPQTYASGRAIHLVVWLGGAGQQTTTRTAYGQACGRDYALSPAFLRDARELAQDFRGPAAGPPLYVTLFSEFQTYPCQANTWAATPAVTNYYRALKAQYLSAMAIFHSVAPNARVSLGWGGWQSRWDDPGKGGGRAMFGYFADVMRASDFESFQAMQSDTNVSDILGMTTILGRYGPVMLAHYKPDSGDQTVWTADMRSIFTDSYVAKVTAAGLFAFSFMDAKNLSASPDSLRLARGATARYGISRPN